MNRVFLKRSYNRLIWIPAFAGMTLLSACSEMDMQGHDPKEYYAKHPIENKVGPNGELISPDCPDWKTSSVTTYSNTKQGNIGCAYTTNLGLMLEDPRDLEQGASGGYIPPDAARNSKVIDQYRDGTLAPTPVTSAGSGN